MANTAVEVRTLETPNFHAIPPAPRHSVTSHLHGWDNFAKVFEFNLEFLGRFKSFYPRILLHRDVKQVRTLEAFPLSEL
jgi:cystathionine gamma-synthase